MSDSQTMVNRFPWTGTVRVTDIEGVTGIASITGGTIVNTSFSEGLISDTPISDCIITGGALDGAPVGAVTPASGRFTTLATTGPVTAGGPLRFSAATVAATGATQGTAAALVNDYTDCTTTAGQTCVILPAALRGMCKVVTAASGNGLNDLEVYPAVGEQIYELGVGPLGVDNSLVLGPGTGYELKCTVAGRWYAFLIAT